MRRPRNRSSSSEAPSDQWASSATMTVVPGRAANAASTSRKSRSRASPSRELRRSGGRARAPGRARHRADPAWRAHRTMSAAPPRRRRRGGRTRRRASSCPRRPRRQRAPRARAPRRLGADAPRVAPGGVRARVAPSRRAPWFEVHDTPAAQARTLVPRSSVASALTTPTAGWSELDVQLYCRSQHQAAVTSSDPADAHRETPAPRIQGWRSACRDAL